MYVVIMGGGKVGEYLAQVLLKSNNEVVIIEKNRKTADRLSMILEGRYLVINGDGCDSKYQEDAGIRRTDVFVAVAGDDEENLVSCEIAMRIYNVPRCISRVNSPKNVRIFREVGIECVSSTSFIANLIEEEAILGSMSAVYSLSHGNTVLFEVVIGRFKHHDNREGIRLGDITMPLDSMIVAVSDKDGVMVANEELEIEPGDTVMVIADTEKVDKARAVLRSL